MQIYVEELQRAGVQMLPESPQLLLQHLNKAALLWSQENDAQADVYSYIYS